MSVRVELNVACTTETIDDAELADGPEVLVGIAEMFSLRLDIEENLLSFPLRPFLSPNTVESYVVAPLAYVVERSQYYVLIVLLLRSALEGVEVKYETFKS